MTSAAASIIGVSLSALSLDFILVPDELGSFRREQLGTMASIQAGARHLDGKKSIQIPLNLTQRFLQRICDSLLDLTLLFLELFEPLGVGHP